MGFKQDFLRYADGQAAVSVTRAASQLEFKGERRDGSMSQVWQRQEAYCNRAAASPDQWTGFKTLSPRLSAIMKKTRVSVEISACASDCAIAIMSSRIAALEHASPLLPADEFLFSEIIGIWRRRPPSEAQS